MRLRSSRLNSKDLRSDETTPVPAVVVKNTKNAAVRMREILRCCVHVVSIEPRGDGDIKKKTSSNASLPDVFRRGEKLCSAFSLIG